MADDTRPDPGHVFVELLETARNVIRSKGGDGSHKSLASELRISPARIGDFLKDQFSITITGSDGEAFEPPRLRKAVAGFAASVERALFWLGREGLLKDGALTTQEVVKSYWPRLYLDHFDTKPVQDGLDEGRNYAQLELDQLDQIKAELWTIAWGPFGSESRVKECQGFLPQYATDLIKGVDPFAIPEPLSKSLPEILNLPARDRKKGLALGVGLCETLYRKFLGFEFVAVPLVNFPIVCLQVSRTKIDALYEFKHVVEGNVKPGKARLAVIQGDMGEALLRSLPAYREKKTADKIEQLIVENSPKDVAKDIADQLWNKTDPDIDDKPLILFSDGIIAFDAFARLGKRGANMHVYDQDETPDFAFSLGIMLRKEDGDVVSLLEQAQQQVLRSSWRVQAHISNLLQDVEKWIGAEQFDKQVIRRWKTPVFQIPGDALTQYLVPIVGSHKRARDIVNTIKVGIENEIKSKEKSDGLILGRLVNFVSPDGPHAGDKTGA